MWVDNPVRYGIHQSHSHYLLISLDMLDSSGKSYQSDFKMTGYF
jgi:hypothetical protein